MPDRWNGSWRHTAGSRVPIVDTGSWRLRGAVGEGDCGATYTLANLLELRGIAVGPPPAPVVALLRHSGLRPYRRRGVRTGRK